MSNVNMNLVDALNRFNQAIQDTKGDSLAAQAKAAQEAFFLAMMDMGSSSPQDAVAPARRGCDALKDLREMFQQQIRESEKVISATDSLIAEFTRAIEKHQR